MQAGNKRQASDDGGIDIRQPQSRMLGKDMTAAGFAPFAVAPRCFVVRADILRALCNLYAELFYCGWRTFDRTKIIRNSVPAR